MVGRFLVKVGESSNLSRGRDAFCKDIVMWHAPYPELVIRLILEHGCTVLNGVKEWPSIRLVLGCILVRREWQVQGSFEARGLTRRAFPNSGASNMTTRGLGARQEVNIEFRSCLFFF